MIKLAVSGCLGRMGRRITTLALEDKKFMLAALLEHPNHPQADTTINDMPIRTDPSVLNNADVLIDFTLPEGTMTNLRACKERGVKMVIGTTGLGPQQVDEIHEAAEVIPIVFSSNMSVGVNIAFKLTEIAAAKTGSAYRSRIAETHHTHKKDAPSGTAKTLAEIIAKSSGKEVRDIQSIREGEVVGDHTVVFESDEDIISISHHAKTRDIFAKGALVAAKFLNDKEKGLFDMQDVLGLK